MYIVTKITQDFYTKLDEYFIQNNWRAYILGNDALLFNLIGAKMEEDSCFKIIVSK